VNQKEGFVELLRQELRETLESVMKEIALQPKFKALPNKIEVDQVLRHAIIFALHGTAFNFLAMLDGSHPFEYEGQFEAYEYELWRTLSGRRTLVNDPSDSELTAFWNTGEWLAEVYGDGGG